MFLSKDEEITTNNLYNIIYDFSLFIFSIEMRF